MKRFTGIAALVLAVLALFHRVLLGETLFFRDLYLLSLPLHGFLASSIRAGSLPLWDPLRHGGLPALDPLGGLFSPVFLPYLFLPPVTAMNVTLILHVLLAALGARALARRLGLSEAAGVAAGAVYGLSGYLLSAVNLDQPLCGLAWAPIAGFFAVGYISGRGPRSLAGAAIALAMPLLSGSAEMFLVSAVLVFILAVFLKPGSMRLRARLAGLGLALAIALGLAAVAILPALDMVRQSSRGDGLPWGKFAFNSVDPRRLPELVVPGFLGPVDTLREEDYWGRKIEDAGFPYLLSLYLGLAFPLALAGGLSRSGALETPFRRALLVLIGGAILLALGRHVPGFHRLYDTGLLPRLFRYPVKAMAFVPLPAALLAGAVVDRRGREIPDGRLAAVLPLALGSALLTILAASFVPALAGRLETAFFAATLEANARAGLRMSFLHAGLFSVLGGLLLTRQARPRHESLAWSLTGVLAIDLLLAGAPLVPTAPVGALAPPPVAREAARLASGGRLFRDADPPALPVPAPTNELVHLLKWNLATLNFYTASSFGIPVIFHVDYDALAPRRVVELGDRLLREPWPRRLAALRAGGVRVVVSWSRLEIPGLVEAARFEAGGGRVLHLYQLERSFRARFVSRVRWARSGPEALKILLTRPGWADEAVLEGVPSPVSPAAECGGAPATVQAGRPEILRVDVNAPCPGWVVMAENGYSGWEAWLDGEAVPILRADFAFRAVRVGAGSHRIEMRYRPRSLMLGATLSALAALMVLLIFLAGSRRRSLRERESGTIDP